MTILIHTNCVHYHLLYCTGYGDCVHHGLKCVLKSLRTCVYFTGLQEEKYFCCNKMFTSRKLTGDEILLSVSMLFQLNRTTNTCPENRRHSDHYRRLDFTSHHTHTHTQRDLNIFSEYFTGTLEDFPSPLTEVAGSKFPMSRCCLIAKLYSLLFQTKVMNIHIIILRHKAINTHRLISCTI